MEQGNTENQEVLFGGCCEGWNTEYTWGGMRKCRGLAKRVRGSYAYKRIPVFKGNAKRVFSSAAFYSYFSSDTKRIILHFSPI